MARRHGVEVIDVGPIDDVPAEVRKRTYGRGSDAVIDAVGMESQGSPLGVLAQKAAGLLPDRLGAAIAGQAGVDRLHALLNSITAVRRGGTLSIVGVYGGAIDPVPMMELFDKGVQIRMGQAHVKRWVDQIMPLVLDDADPLGTHDLATHTLPLEKA